MPSLSSNGADTPIIPFYYHKRLRPGMKLLHVQQPQSYTPREITKEDSINQNEALKKTIIAKENMVPIISDDCFLINGNMNATLRQSNSMVNIPLNSFVISSETKELIIESSKCMMYRPDTPPTFFFTENIEDIKSSAEYKALCDLKLLQKLRSQPRIFAEISPSPPLSPVGSDTCKLLKKSFLTICKNPTIYDLENYLIQLLNVSGEKACGSLVARSFLPFATVIKYTEDSEPIVPISFMVKNPPNINPNIWLYQHLKRICIDMNYIGLLLAKEDECDALTKKGCEKMMIRNINWQSTFLHNEDGDTNIFKYPVKAPETQSEQAGQNIPVVCPSNIHKTPKNCSAMDYIWHTLDWSMGILTSNLSEKTIAVAPQRYYHNGYHDTINSNSQGQPPPVPFTLKEKYLEHHHAIKISNRKFNLIFKRLFLIFNHIYFHHLTVFKKSVYLYKRMIALGIQFDLIRNTLKQNNESKTNLKSDFNTNSGIYNIPFFASLDELLELTYGSININDYDYEAELNKIIHKIDIY